MRAAGSESYYEVLGVPPTATQEQIRFAYRTLAAHYHPDKHQGNPLQELAAEKLGRINAAHEVLSDPERRAAYDATLPAASPGLTGRRGRRGPTWITLAIAALLGLLLLRPALVLFARLVRVATGTPAGLILFAAAAVGGVVWWVRRRARR